MKVMFDDLCVPLISELKALPVTTAPCPPPVSVLLSRSALYSLKGIKFSSCEVYTSHSVPSLGLH